MTWAQKKRFEWIGARLQAGEPFNRADIREAFATSIQTASSTVREYQTAFPGMLAYDRSAKRFVPGPGPPPPAPSEPQGPLPSWMALVEMLRECVDELEAEKQARLDGRRRHKRDVFLAARARALLDRAGA